MKQIVYSVILIVINMILIYMSHKNGKTFYEERSKKCKKSHKVFDICHKYLPDHSHDDSWHVAMNIFIFAPLLFNMSIFEEYLSYSAPILLFKQITSNVTILPKSKNCNDDSFKLMYFLNGHCYDKIFSGHFAGSVLISMILYNRGIVTNPYILGLYNLISAYLILTSYLLKINIDFVKDIF
jgi:hypothetical protein